MEWKGGPSTSPLVRINQQKTFVYIVPQLRFASPRDFLSTPLVVLGALMLHLCPNFSPVASECLKPEFRYGKLQSLFRILFSQNHIPAFLSVNKEIPFSRYPSPVFFPLTCILRACISDILWMHFWGKRTQCHQQSEIATV